MAEISILIDSNVFIAAEDHGSDGHVFGPQAAKLLSLAQKLHINVMVSSATKSDLLQAAEPLRQRRLRQLEKYFVLNEIASLDLADYGWG